MACSIGGEGLRLPVEGFLASPGRISGKAILSFRQLHQGQMKKG